MSRTVTALYDTRAEAEAARDRLAAEVEIEGRAKIIDKSSMDAQQGSSDFHSVPLSSDDRSAYGEGLNRGGFMLCAEVDGDEDADKIVAILEETSSVDLDERQKTWRNEGWSGSKGADERMEQVQNTLRNTNAEVDEGRAGSRGALGFDGDRKSNDDGSSRR